MLEKKKKKRACLAVVQFPRVLHLYITLVRIVLLLLLMAKGL